jgi:hypothetical protein
MPDIDVFIENLAGVLGQANEAAKEILSILNNEQVPSLGQCTELSSHVQKAALIEENILAGFKAQLPTEPLTGKKTITEYRKLSEKIKNESQSLIINFLIQTLQKFANIVSNEPEYDTAIKPYRDETVQKKEVLKSIQSAQALADFQSGLEGIIAIVEILEKHITDDENPLFETISKHISSALVYRGLTKGKYYFPSKPAVVKTLPPKSLQEEKSIHDKVTVSEETWLRPSPDIFKSHMQRLEETITRPGEILALGTWLIYFCAEDMLRIVLAFRRGEAACTLDDIKFVLHEMQKKSYVLGFKISEDGTQYYAVSSNFLVWLKQDKNRRIFDVRNTCRLMFIKYANKNTLLNLTDDGFQYVSERNSGCLTFLEFVIKYFEKELQDDIIHALECNLHCIFSSTYKIVLLTSKIMKYIDDVQQENTLGKFLLDNPDLSIVITDTDDIQDVQKNVLTFFPNRTCLTLESFANRHSVIVNKNSMTRGVDDYPSEAAEDKAENSFIDDINHSAVQEPDRNPPISEKDVIQTLAEYIYKTPDPEEEKVHELIDLLLDQSHLPSSGDPDRIAQAAGLVFAFTRGKYKDNSYYSNMNKKIQLALGLRLDDISYDSGTIGEVFPDDKELTLKVPALFRSLFSPDVTHDSSLYVFGETLHTQALPYLGDAATPVKEILSCLLLLKKTDCGFTPGILSKLSGDKTRVQYEQKLEKQAAELINKPNIKARLYGMPDFIELCFGSKSNLTICMEWVIQNDYSKNRDAQTVLDDLFSDDDKINDFIDEKWSKASGNNGVKKLENTARKMAYERIRKQINLIKEWIGFSITDAETHRMNPILEQVRNQLLTKLPNTIKCVESSNQEGAVLLLLALQDLHRALTEGVKPETKYIFVDFLRSHWIALDEKFVPCFNSSLESIPEMEPWRCVAGHIADPESRSFEDVLELIKSSKNENYYDNLGQALRIEEYLGVLNGYDSTEKKKPWESNKIKMMALASSKEEDFKSELELAFADGRIEEHVKERLLQTAQATRDYYWQLQYFAGYDRFLNCLKVQCEEQGNSIGSALQEQFDAYLVTLPEARSDHMLEEEIRKLLKNRNYAVAEDYINRFKSGETTIQEDTYKDEDYFSDFLKRFDEIKQLLPSNSVSLKNQMPRIKRDKNLSQRQIDSSNALFNNWPSGHLAVSTNELKELFRELGFSVERVDSLPGKNGNNFDVFEMKAEKTEKNLRDYSHPIDQFGTSMSDRINIVCIFGQCSINELVDNIINKLNLGKNAIVFYDNVYDKNVRRKLVEFFFTNTSKQNSFLFIDRVLITYLATLDKGVRLSALLRCTLPYTSYQPFNSGGSGPIPDEMFFGRQKELDLICDFKGPNLVYGGRQLGKTALLERAKSLNHLPDKQEYAIYVNGDNCGIIETLKKTKNEFRLETREVGATLFASGNTWESFCNSLRECFRAGRIKKLLLLIDEADEFLKEAGKDEYKILTYFTDLKRRCNFKFVFAGLHDVIRSRVRLYRDNSLFGQMAPPLCITPLSPGDARNLLKRPLAFLGYNMEHLNQLELILANTNYYPGILHFFGYKLIQSVAENYRRYYSSEKNNPPFDLENMQLKSLFSDNDLNEEIRKKLRMTLELDSNYEILANLIAYLYYTNENNSNLAGYTVFEIIQIANDYSVKQILDLKKEEVRGFLLEMVEMGILWTDPLKELYRLRRNNFLNTIGDQSSVENFILEHT